jgi:hypothetical protein
MNVLVACESSGTVREAFRKLGHNAWSCDLLPADDNSPYHVVGDARYVIANMIANDGRDMIPINQAEWDLVIAHPPCTHLASSGARHFAAKRADGRQQEGIDLFLAILECCQKHAKKWAIENPIGIMSRLYRKPDQIIQPWMFGHPETKATCLWLGWLKPLVPTHDVKADMLALPVAKRHRIHHMPPSKDRWKLRSKTYQGIADAMASQWGRL